jgi:hypothetical protein
MPGVQWRDPDLHEVIEFLSNPNSVIKVIIRLLMIYHHQNFAPELSVPDPYVFGASGIRICVRIRKSQIQIRIRIQNIVPHPDS